MTSELSQMLDELMGKNRNAAPDDKGNDLHWSDKDVCKHFLCGFCPAELFTNTRSDLGPCEKIHDEALRKTYEQSNRYMKMSYEEEFLHYLQQCMTDVERRIRRNHQRLQLSEEKNQKVVTPNKDVDDQINLLTQRIEELLQKIEQLGNEGNVEEAQGVMKLCDQLKDDREQLYGQQKGTVLDQFSVQEKQMEVCEVCGAFLIVGDAQSRVDDHLMGKQHMGYAKIKTHIEELKEKLKKKAEVPPEVTDSKRRRLSRDDGKDREKRRDDRRLSHSRDGKRDRDRDRHRSRDRDSRQSRGANRRHSREKDGRRHDDRRDSGRHRSRDKDRDSRRSKDLHSGRSKDDKERRSSHRSRSRDRDRRHSRKHSRPRSRSRDRKDKDRKKSRRSDSQERKQKEETCKEKENENGNTEKTEHSTTNQMEDQNNENRDENVEGEKEPTVQTTTVKEIAIDSTDDGPDEQQPAIGSASDEGDIQPPGTEGDQ